MSHPFNFLGLGNFYLSKAQKGSYVQIEILDSLMESLKPISMGDFVQRLSQSQLRNLEVIFGKQYLVFRLEMNSSIT